MTWRERIAQARERGSFTQEDRSAWDNPMTCLVGEVVSAREVYDSSYWVLLNDNGRPAGLQEGMLTALHDGDFDFVERRLEEIEDRALQLKREAAS